MYCHEFLWFGLAFEFSHVGTFLSSMTCPAAPESTVTLTFTHLSFTWVIFLEIEF